MNALGKFGVRQFLRCSGSRRGRGLADHRKLLSGEGYQGFGSFHVEHSVEDMIQMSNSEFENAVPDTHRHISHSKLSKSAAEIDFRTRNAFGAEVREACFSLDNDCTFLNHGAFGSPIIHGELAAHKWRQEAERQPLRFMDRTLLPELVRTTRLVSSSILGASRSDTVLVSNATTGLNAVFSSLRRHDLLKSVLFLDCAYGADKTMSKFFAVDGVVEVPVLAGLTVANVTAVNSKCAASEEKQFVNSNIKDRVESFDDYIVRKVEQSLKMNPQISLAVFDHITSNTAIQLPIAALTKVCHEQGVPVLIDGAHTVGQVPHFGLDVSGTVEQPCNNLCKPDFFVGNFHKWFLAPRGSGFLWCNPQRGPTLNSSGHQNLWKDIVRHPIVSHGDSAGYHSSFCWFGNADYSSLLALRATAESVWLQNDEATSNILSYMSDLNMEGADFLAKQWGFAGSAGSACTSGFFVNPRFSVNAAPGMALVQLPSARLWLHERIASGQSCSGETDIVDAREHVATTSTDAKRVQDWLFRHNVEVPVKCVNGRLYIRISAHIYNDIEQYMRLANLVAGVAV